MEEFAGNILQAVRSGQLPAENLERVTVALAQMVISLAQTCKVQQELAAAGREAGDALAMMLNHPHLKGKGTIPKA